MGRSLSIFESNDVVELLADRETATLARWFGEHAGVEIIARDRAGTCARGERDGAPAAWQIANRWHFLRNGYDSLLRRRGPEPRTHSVKAAGLLLRAQAA